MPHRTRVQDLLEELNLLEQNYGRVLSERDQNYDPPGEVQARVKLLKGELEALGAQIAWDGQQYRIIDRTNP
jgi:hypothetical protein